MSVTATFKMPTAALARHAASVRARASRVAVQVAHGIANDAVFEQPRPPIKDGTLRGAVNVRPAGEGAAEVSFDTAYAARLHEVGETAAAGWPSLLIDPLCGPKWLSSKLQRNGDKYNKEAASRMREASK